MSAFAGYLSGSLYSLFTILLGTVAYLYVSNHALNSVKGPLLARWTRLWIVRHSRRGDMHRVMIHLHEKYGSLVRTGPNEISVAEPNVIRTIYGAGTKFRKSDWYSVWQGRRAFDLFGERNESIHSAQRRLVSAIYSLESLLDLEPYIDDALSFMMSRLVDMEGRVINMNLWAQLFAFDVIGEVTFSKRFGFMDSGQDDGSFAQIDSALHSASWVGQVPWIYWVQDWLDPIIGNHLGIRARHGSLRSFAAKEVKLRKERGSDRTDILEKLMRVQKEKPEDMNEMAIISMATSNIFAGSDTTAISIGAILYFLCQNPTCQKQVLSEIATVLGSDAPRDTITYESTRKMKYLQACINEALRLHPAVGMSLPRIVPEGGININNVYIPGGTVIGVNPWVLHRNKSIFGEDADSFRPERWLSEKRGEFERYFFAFGAGSRICIGKNLSLIEISKLIPLLLLNFDMELASAGECVTENCWWFVKLAGLNMKLKRKFRP
ncbi:cytochrome P450 [Periconia macrospinosa]|uniref:Cytochrome P450 n=1 Tax=Periconia macrospinosa TaxID=97972 RepID=A0A2V1DG01_9PLEO|nr:cytochrome P450 [Periconia macrospinosa]